MLTNHPESMTTDELIRLFTVVTKDEVCSAAGRELTDDEFEQFEETYNMMCAADTRFRLEEVLEEAGIEE